MTNEQKNQVAAMNASGMSVDEITIDTGLDKQAIIEWYQSGHPVSQTAKKFGVDPKTVKNALGLLKEKEPVPAPTETSSNENIVQVQNTTVSAESQALEAARKKLLAIYETLTPEETRAWELGEVYAEVVRGLGE